MSVCVFYINCMYNRKCEIGRYYSHDPHKQSIVSRSVRKKSKKNRKRRFEKSRRS